MNVNFFGDVSLNGNALINVQKIIGMDGKWRIDEVDVDGGKGGDQGDLAVEVAATFGTPENTSGITIYDRITKEPVCVFSENNLLASSPGPCQLGPESSTSSTPGPRPGASPRLGRGCFVGVPPDLKLLSDVALDTGTSAATTTPGE